MPAYPSQASSARLTPTGFQLWLSWTVLTALAFLLSLYWIEVSTRPHLGWIEGAVGGALLGGAQWLVLRQRLPQAWQWWLATFIGWSLLGFSSLGPLGWIAPREAYAVPLRMFYGVLNGAQVGAWIGLLQWAVLRQWIRPAWQWVFGSLVSWAAGLASGWAIGTLLYQTTHLFLGEVVGLLIGWLVTAGMTGMVLVQVLRNLRSHL